jgi:hypothetical protein
MGSEWTLKRLVWGVVEWIHLAQDRDRWRAVVNAVMNLRVLAPRSQLKSTDGVSTFLYTSSTHYSTDHNFNLVLCEQTFKLFDLLIYCFH